MNPTTIVSGSASGTKTLASDIEDDLFLGPVYKRLLVRKLCEVLSKGASSSTDGLPSAPTSSIVFTHSKGLVATSDPKKTSGHSSILPPSAFSVSCQKDLGEFYARCRPRDLTRRHLPFASIDARQKLNDNEQDSLDRRFYDAALLDNLSEVAKALQLGADINFRMAIESGHNKTALEACVQRWMKQREFLGGAETHIAEFLLLYKETYIPFSFDGSCTILHLCMVIGATANFMRPFCDSNQNGEELQLCDALGKSVTDVANRCSLVGRVTLMRFRRNYSKASHLDSFLEHCYGLAYNAALDTFLVIDWWRFRVQEEAEHRFTWSDMQAKDEWASGQYQGAHTCSCESCKRSPRCRTCRTFPPGRMPECLKIFNPLLSKRPSSV